MSGSRTSGRLRRTWRSVLLPLRRVVMLEDTPERIARGSAAGMLTAYLPTVGQTFIGMAVAWLMRGSTLAAIPWSWITNPFTTLPLWYASYRIGCVVIGREAVVTMGGLATAYADLAGRGLWDALVHGAAILGGMFLPMLLGSLLLGLVTAIPTHWLVRRAVEAVQTRRARRAAEWRERLARGGPGART